MLSVGDFVNVFIGQRYKVIFFIGISNQDAVSLSDFISILQSPIIKYFDLFFISLIVDYSVGIGIYLPPGGP